MTPAPPLLSTPDAPPVLSPAPAARGWPSPDVLARLAVVGLAAVLRLYALDQRPPHFDEGVNGWFTDQMQQNGFYKYDPTNYHGPLHFYVLFLFKCLFGRNLWALRLPVALVGILTVDWIFRFKQFFGSRLCFWAALAMTFSPGLLYFQRDAIHETWLVFFLILGFWGLCGLWQDGDRRFLWAAGMGLTGMILTKETYVIHIGCLLVAVPFVLLIERYLPSRRAFLAPLPTLAESEEGRRSLWAPSSELAFSRYFACAPRRWKDNDALAVLGVSFLLIAFFYSGNGFHPEGIKGLVTAFKPWGHKAQEGEGHNKAFIYWTKLLLRNEPWGVFGLLACLRYGVPALPARPGRRWLGLAGLAVCLGVLGLGGSLLFGIAPASGLEGTQHWLTGLSPALGQPLPDGLLKVVPFGGGLGKAAVTGLEVLAWAVGLAAVGGAVVSTSLLGLPPPPDWRLRLLAVYAPGTLLAYSLIPYKTPWCIISFVWPFFFLGAALLAEASEHRGEKAGGWLAAPAAGLLLTGTSAYLAVRLNYFQPTEEKQDYVYVQTFDDMWKITDPMLALARSNPEEYHLHGLILCNSTYPLPWMLGDFNQIGYHSDDNPPTNFQADFLLVTEAHVREVEEHLDGDFFKEKVDLRSGLTGLSLYLRAPLFAPFLAPGRQPEFHALPRPPAVPAPPTPPALPPGVPADEPTDSE